MVLMTLCKPRKPVHDVTHRYIVSHRTTPLITQNVNQNISTKLLPVHSLKKYSPALLSLWTGPVQATHVTNNIVWLEEGPEDTEHWVGHHDQQWQHPGGSDDTIGVGPGLPWAGLQRVTDGAVSFDGNGHKAEGGDADRDPCRKMRKQIITIFVGDPFTFLLMPLLSNFILVHRRVDGQIHKKLYPYNSNPPPILIKESGNSFRHNPRSSCICMYEYA